MRYPKVPPQIVRLIILTLVIVGSYVAARALLTPASFGQYGFYRGDALEEIASRKPVYAGMQACTECHSDKFKQLSKGEHKTISCESCHRAALAHADNPDIPTHKLTDSECLRCHAAEPARPKLIKQITIKDHYRGEPCIGCHVPHHPSEVP